MSKRSKKMRLMKSIKRAAGALCLGTMAAFPLAASAGEAPSLGSERAGSCCRVMATGRIIAEFEFFEPMTIGSLITLGQRADDGI